MNSIFRNVSCALICAGFVMFSNNVFAQNLPANPWATKQATTTNNTQNTTTIKGLPANPWQGSGNSITGHNTVVDGNTNVGQPVYTGQSTTWNTAMGQAAIAPEVNVHNMLSMTNHLRSLGYQIPPSFDNFIRTAPAKIRVKIMTALKQVRKGDSDPLTNVLATVIKDAEKSSGFSTENLLGNSLDLLSK